MDLLIAKFFKITQFQEGRNNIDKRRFLNITSYSEDSCDYHPISTQLKQ